MSKVNGQSVDREDGNEQGLNEAEVQWMRDKMRRTVERLRAPLAGDPDGTVVYTPGGYGTGGTRFWMRDCFYMVEDYRRNDACECINKAGVRRIPGYGASVANLMAALDRMRAERNIVS